MVWGSMIEKYEERHVVAFEVLLKRYLFFPIQDAIQEGVYPEKPTPEMCEKLGGISPEDFHEVAKDASDEMLRKVDEAIIDSFMGILREREDDGESLLDEEEIEAFCLKNRLNYYYFLDDIILDYLDDYRIVEGGILFTL